MKKLSDPLTVRADVRALVHVPMDPLWLQSSRGFKSEDPSMVRATMNLFFAAWHEVPTGCIRVDRAALATGLTERQLAQHEGLLFDGWTRCGEHWVFLPMLEMGEKMTRHYSKSLDMLAAGAAVSAQAPDLFGDTHVAARSPLKGTRAMDPDYPLTPEAKAKIVEAGYSTRQADAVWTQFRDFCVSRDLRFKTQAQMLARLSNWMHNGETFNQLVPENRTTNLAANKPLHQQPFRVGLANRTPVDRGTAAIESTRLARERVRTGTRAIDEVKPVFHFAPPSAREVQR